MRFNVRENFTQKEVKIGEEKIQRNAASFPNVKQKLTQ